MRFSTKQFGPPIQATASCPIDCAQPCEIPANCIEGHDWEASCEGHWDCQAQLCVPVCDYDSCGDGTCDTLNGETPQSCIADCSGYSCTTRSDCDVLAFPDGCTGTWICSGAIRVPQCE